MANSISSPALKDSALKRAVASIYTTLGAQVKFDVSLAGSQIDLIVLLPDSSGTQVVCAVECKAYSKLVGLATVQQFHAVTNLLRERHLINKAILISITGFTSRAKSYAKERGIEFILFSELQQKLKGREKEVVERVDETFEKIRSATSSPLKSSRIFVVMPFAVEFMDVYVLGIRDVAEKLGLVVERADDIEHNSQILEVIQQRIQDSNLIIADTSLQNPNVYYEIGYAHASGIPTILITRRGQKIPFDLQSTNHIFYETIVDLREKLEKRIRATLNLKAAT